MGRDRLAILRDVLRDMVVDFDAAVTGLDSYLENVNPFTPDEARRYETEFGRLDDAVREAHKRVQAFRAWLDSRHEEA